jgi:hypothetical protein
MRTQQTAGWTRRCFLGGLTVAGTAGLLGLRPRSVAAEPQERSATMADIPQWWMKGHWFDV